MHDVQAAPWVWSRLHAWRSPSFKMATPILMAYARALLPGLTPLSFLVRDGRFTLASRVRNFYAVGLLRMLTALEITMETVRYREKSEREDDLPTTYCKNLFLKDRKGSFYLVIYKEDSILDLKLLKKQVKAYRNFSFASHAELKTIMKVNCVTPFSLVYLSTANVQIVIAKSLLQETSINFHPLDGRFTTRISFDDLELFLKSLGRYRDVKFVDIWDLLKLNSVNKLYAINNYMYIVCHLLICSVNKKGELSYCVYTPNQFIE